MPPRRFRAGCNLGAEGFASFDSVRWGGFALRFNSLGGRERVVTIERKGETFRVVEMTNGGRGRGSFSGSSWSIVEKQLGLLAKLIPADI